MVEGINIEINDSNLNQFFAALPNKVGPKTMVAIARKGATAVNGELRKAMPGNLKKFKAILGAKASRNKQTPLVTAGFFGRKVQYVNRTGKRWDAWQLVYWHNYGTYANRDGSHNFVKARKSVSAHVKGGLHPLRFFEKGIAAGSPKAEKKMIENANQIIDKAAKKYGFR